MNLTASVYINIMMGFFIVFVLGYVLRMLQDWKLKIKIGDKEETVKETKEEPDITEEEKLEEFRLKKKGILKSDK